VTQANIKMTTTKPTTKNCTLFYVDNDPDDLAVFGKACSDLGYDVTLFDAPEKMIFALEHTIPCVLIVDLSLPHSSGYEITAELKSHKKFKNIPIVAYSDTVAKVDIQRIVSLGADYFIKKPMNPTKIKEAIVEAFDAMGIEKRCGILRSRRKKL
jgi:CheY-like chemotaxis protein